MPLGIMQPYFFPYVGYFSLMHAVDHWVVFDTPQYIRRGWVNRNRVLTTGSEQWKYVQIPTKKSPRSTPISEIQVSSAADWRTDIIRNLDYYEQHRAPYYRQTMDFLNTAFSFESVHLSELLIHFLKETSDLLGILPARFDVFSRMDVTIGPVSHSGEWALRISEAVKADAYINPISGRDIFKSEAFDRLGITLKFLEPDLREYEQCRDEFVPGLSILDCLMWLGPEQVRDQVARFRLVSG